jgi:hypothetical protein
METKVSRPSFTRAGAAKVARVRPTVLRDWARGRPVTILPSIEAPGRKGAKTIYSLSDLYTMNIALALSMGGLSFKKIAAVLPKIVSHPEWFSAENRGVLRFHSLETQNPGVEHAPIPVSDANNSEAIKFYLSHGRTQCHHLNLKGILDLVDERVKQLPAGPHDA